MLNNVCVMGRLVRSPELRRTGNGTAVCSFTIACDRYAKKGEEKKADFLDVVAWRSTAEFIAQYFDKGSAIVLSGRLQSRSYEDKAGNKRKAIEIVADDVSFAGSKGNGSAEAQTATEYAGSSTADFAEINIDDEDLPF